jgi:predicted Zn-dependent protease
MNQRQAAIYYLEEEAFGRAEKLLHEWVLAHPDDIYAHMELIACFYRRSTSFNRWKNCDHFFSQIYDRPNAQVVKRFVRAEQLYYEGRKEESLLHYKNAIDGGLDVPVLHHSLAMAFGVLGRKVEAEAEYEKALDQEPRFLPALVAYSQLLFDEGRFDRVEAILHSIDSLEPQSLKYKFRDALEDLKSLEIMRKACFTLRRCVGLYNEEKVEGAALVLWPVLSKHRDNCWFVRTLVYLFYRAIWLRSGKKRLAEVLAEESPISSYAAGLTLWYEKKYEEALQAYDTAIEKGLDHALVRCARALAYEELGKNQEREADLLAALSDAPWCIYAKEDLARLKYEQGKSCEVVDLANVTSEEYECAVNYDISGRISLVNLEQLALSSLLKLDKALRIEQYKAPCEDEDLHFQRAMVYAENQQFNEAASELTESVRLDYCMIGTSDKANRERLRLIIQEEPSCFGVALSQAILPAFGDELKEAKENLESLVRSFANEPEAWYHLANVSSVLGDQEGAKEACREALAVDSGCRNALLLLCRLLYEAGEIEGLQLLSRELGGAKEPLEFALQWAKENGQPQIGKQIASELLEIDPPNTSAVFCFMEGLDLEDVEYARLADHLTTSIPIDFERRTLVARTLFLYGEAEEALERYDSLFADGCESARNVLMCGLALLAAEAPKKT